MQVYRKVNGTRSNLIVSGELPALRLRPGTQYIDITLPIAIHDPSAGMCVQMCGLCFLYELMYMRCVRACFSVQSVHGAVHLYMGALLTCFCLSQWGA